MSLEPLAGSLVEVVEPYGCCSQVGPALDVLAVQMGYSSRYSYLEYHR